MTSASSSLAGAGMMFLIPVVTSLSGCSMGCYRNGTAERHSISLIFYEILFHAIAHD
jgi:hypothetical protein